MKHSAVLTLASLLLAGCARPASRPALEQLRGPRLEQPMPKPSFVLQNLDGTPFDFRQATRGKLTFLFFGYRNCPDVCPLHMANLAWALRTVPEGQRRSIRVVFVTTDPERDTPDQLRSWLQRFDPSFIGVTGTAAALEAAQRSVGMPPAMREGELPKGGGYGITHAAQIWAFTPDDSAHVIYPFGVKREDLAADLATLLRMWPPSP
jgi:protein SCO1/2